MPQLTVGNELAWGERAAAAFPTRTKEQASLDWKVALAIGYLALPNYLFFAGWFRLSSGIVAIGLVTLLLFWLFRHLKVNGGEFHIPAQGYLLVASAAWAFFGGGSHFVHANPDWYIRDAVIGDLIQYDWPVVYTPADGGSWVLRSAFGYFLPPAVISKIFGAAMAPAAIFIWTMIGVYAFLNLLPLPEKQGPRLAAAIMLVVFFSGMDFVGQWIATESLPQFPERLEWWGPFSYPSLTGQLLWAPNHCIPLWLGAALLMRHARSDDFLLLAVLVVTLSLIWTPFAVPGLVPLALFVLVRRTLAGQSIDMQWLPLLCAGLLAAPILLFLTADISGIATASALNAIPASPQVLTHHFSLQAYLLFVCCEFAFLGLALLGNPRRDRGCFLFALAVLLALPLFRLGPSNDLLLRASTPFLVVLLIECLHTLFGDKPLQSRLLAVLATAMLLIGAHTAFNEFWRGATYPKAAPDYRTSLLAKQGGRPVAHYMGRLYDSPWLTWILQKPDSRSGG